MSSSLARAVARLAVRPPRLGAALPDPAGARRPLLRHLSTVPSSSSETAAAGGHAGLARVAAALRGGEIPKGTVVTMAGAGISVAAGIPDFRSEGGLYSDVDKYAGSGRGAALPYPEAIFERDYFANRDPLPFLRFCRDLYPGEGRHRPTRAHFFLRLLHEEGFVLRHFTQNIDGLERLAGIPEDVLVEAHGTIATASCLLCGLAQDPAAVRDAICRPRGEPDIPRCRECHGLVKPDVVLFGEMLPTRFYELQGDVEACQMLFVMGTSLQVFPFAALASEVPRGVPRVFINKTSVGDHREEDVRWIGDLEVGVTLLARLLGWEERLEALAAAAAAAQPAAEPRSTSR